ncbi:MAG: site-specific DNA-methyltransferase, partial [Armatimonadetes bacterium]|nr:site-specific DNA-methyltransferase [Armatimonadota bacterium]
MNSIDPGRNNIVLGDCLDILRNLPAASFQLFYIDPPFNTGEMQGRISLKVAAEAERTRLGFGGKRYRAESLAEKSCSDRHEDYLAFLEPRLQEAHRVLSFTGSLFFHIDYREA